VENMPNLEDIIIAPGVRETTSEDGAVLLDIDQGICFSLNPVGLRIWEMLKQHHSLERIIDALERDFHVPRTDLAVDVREFLRELEFKHLIWHGGLGSAKPKHRWRAKMFAWRLRTFGN
jgi:hypothetical protein